MARTTAAAAAKLAPAPADAGDVKQVLTDAKPPIAALLANEIWVRETGIRLNTWEAFPPAGTPFDNVLRKEFWANVSRRMKRGDKIIVMPRDGVWYAELLVWDAGQNWAHVAGGAAYRPALEAAPGVENEFEIFTDPVDGVCVRRKSGTLVKANFPNHEDARRWILDHQKALRT